MYQGLRPGRLMDVYILWRTLQALPCDDANESCVANAISNLCQSFLLSYGVRVGIRILLSAFKLARGKSYSSFLDLKDLVDAVDQEDIAKLSDAVKELNSMRLMTQLNCISCYI
ncbi:hypothetical protein RHMOL_Rhmol08G0035200 [Rhododendron molle]|uniref:Uncharacterized protein n=1 Tax=Rhododendron molle TaxID=49168 RepID=A0ACC0MJZ3_RHOML|nr:hypothetical protein RHMOL_Rhmol08G0035200 [Rhododendron molle]